MNGPFHIGATGLEAQQRALEVVANNLANVNTAGFKRSDVSFRELMSRAAPLDGALPPVADGNLAFSGVSLAEPRRSFAPGDLRQTGRPLDLAIEGQGFIELMGPAGRTLLWRGGTLKVNADGFLATAEGLPLKAMISVPADALDLIVNTVGDVQATIGGEGVRLGQIDLVLARDTSLLNATDDGTYESIDPAMLMNAAPGKDGAGLLVQGALESSNVELTEEMVTLMLTQRAYAANAQVIQAGDQLMAIANQLRR